MRNFESLRLSALVLAVACSKPNSTGSGSAPSAGSSASTTAIPAANTALESSGATQSQPSGEPPIPPAPTAAAAPGATVPESFAGGHKVNVEGAVGQGCEARSSSGWLELVCRKKNGSGGRPLRAILDAETAEEVKADEYGELPLRLPFGADQKRDVLIEWTNTRYVLKLDGASAKLEWPAATLELRRACAKLADESKAQLAAAQKPDAASPVTAADVAKLPRFGICVQGGFGSWALGLKAISTQGEGPAPVATAGGGHSG